MKKVLRVFLIVFTIFLCSFFIKESVQAYSCASGYYCNLNGGKIMYIHYVPYTEYPRQCVYHTPHGYTCTGTDSSCSGGEGFYNTYEDCMNKTNVQGQYCCDPLPSCTTTCSSCTPPACPSGYTSDPSATACRAPNTTSTSCTVVLQLVPVIF